MVKGEGGVYGWGDNHSFELGFMNIENYEEPKKVNRAAFVFRGSEGGEFDPEVENLEGEKVTGIFCGNRVSYFQTASCLYSVGDEQFGKLGLGPILGKVFKPTRLILPTKLPILGISCGIHHSLAWDLGGKLYSWGKNSHSQLGHLYQKFDAGHFESSPLLVESMLEHRVVLGHCSQYGSYIINERGSVFYWGQCLNFEPDAPKLRELQVPKKLNFEKSQTGTNNKPPRIIKISGYYKNFAALDLNGYLYTFGMNNEWNVLGLKGIAQPKFITKGRHLDLGYDNYILDMTCGDGFMVVISHNSINDKVRCPEKCSSSYDKFKNLWFRILHGKLDRIKDQTGNIKHVRGIFDRKMVKLAEESASESNFNLEDLIEELEAKETSGRWNGKPDSTQNLKLMPRFVQLIQKSGIQGYDHCCTPTASHNIAMATVQLSKSIHHNGPSME